MNKERLKKLAGIESQSSRALLEQPLVIPGVDMDIVDKMLKQSASWFNHYRRPGTLPVPSVEEWLDKQPWSDMKEMWRNLSLNSKSELARHIVGMNTH